MKIIGTDVSLDVCKAEGYTMIEFDARKKFRKDRYIRIFDFIPDYCETAGDINTDVELTFDDLVELYNEDKESIDIFAETNKHVNFDSPTEYDFLNLASDLISYKGLQ